MNPEKENIIRVLARYRVMCPGLSFLEILQVSGLPNPARFENIEKSPLFREIVQQMQDRVDDSVIEQGSLDPVLVKAKLLAAQAIQRLGEEVNNLNKETEGATASTRIIASNSILQLLGYGGKDRKDSAVVNITISDKQAASISVSQPVSSLPSVISEKDI